MPENTRKTARASQFFSHHFKGKRQVFYAYHWLVRRDGKQVRLLADNQIGWHAGDWEINKRSVGICLDGDFTDSKPSKKVLLSVAKLINKNYPQVKKENVFGYCEINLKTIYPGNLFLSDWKAELLKLIYGLKGFYNLNGSLHLRVLLSSIEISKLWQSNNIQNQLAGR